MEQWVGGSHPRPFTFQFLPVTLPPMPWHVYIVRCGDGTLYTGVATDLARRVAAPTAGPGAKYTRANKPVRLIGKIAYPDRGSATRAEIAFKKLSRTEKQMRIGKFSGSSR